MSREFPPLSGSERSSDDDLDTEPFDDDDLDELEASNLPENLPAGSGDFEADVRWAWDRISDDDVQPENAPNGCSWYLLVYGRSNPEKFVAIVVKALGKTGTDAKRFREDRDFQFSLLANITREFAGQACEHCGCGVIDPPSSSNGEPAHPAS